MGLLNYQFWGNQTIQIYGDFEGFPLWQCVVWVGNTMTPVGSGFFTKGEFLVGLEMMVIHLHSSFVNPPQFLINCWNLIVVNSPQWNLRHAPLVVSTLWLLIFCFYRGPRYRCLGKILRSFDVKASDFRGGGRRRCILSDSKHQRTELFFFHIILQFVFSVQFF